MPCTRRAVSVWVSKWSRPRRPCRSAQARTSGSAIEWSPPSTIGIVPAFTASATVRRIAACDPAGSAGITGASPKSTTRSSAIASTPVSRWGPGSPPAARIARGPWRVPGDSETSSSIGAPMMATSTPDSSAASSV